MKKICALLRIIKIIETKQNSKKWSRYDFGQLNAIDTAWESCIKWAAVREEMKFTKNPDTIASVTAALFIHIGNMWLFHYIYFFKFAE